MMAPMFVDGQIVMVTSGTFTSPIINTGVLNSPTIVMTGGQMSGGIANNVILGGRTVVTLASGATKTLDFSTGDIFIANLTQACTLTVSNASTGKVYQLVVHQNIADSYTDMSWMTGFVNGKLASGPTQSTGAVDFWTITFDGINHFGMIE